jgi:Ca-activated chloride channel homolog
MSLSWPWALLVIAVVPALLAFRWWQARRRKRGAVVVSSVALVRSAQPSTTRWRRVVPPALLLLALVALGVAAARPHREASVSSNAVTILLALDVSRSMCSTDVEPNRLEAAQGAATDFIEAQPEGSRIGLVTFARFAAVTVPPTDDTEALVRAVDSLVTSRGTAIGQGILTSIDAIAELDASVPRTGADVPDGTTPDDAAAVIVLLTDGSNRDGVDPATAAEQAADRGIRVYTIGFGTETPAPGVCNAAQVAPGGGFGGGFGGVVGGRRGHHRAASAPDVREPASLTPPRSVP